MDGLLEGSLDFEAKAIEAEDVQGGEGKVFKEATGLTVVEFILKMRIVRFRTISSGVGVDG